MRKRLKLIMQFICIVSYLVAYGTIQVSAQEHINQRQITLLEKYKRPNDPWPRGDGHVIVGEPGSPVSQKGYHEPGGSFCPSPGSFGVSIWVLDGKNKLVATSDDIPMDKIGQQYVFQNNSKIPSIQTETPYYKCTWSNIDMGKWELNITDANKGGNHVLVVFRSVGPAGGPMESVIWDKSLLLLNYRWIITPSVAPDSVFIGDEGKGELMKAVQGKESVVSPHGWGFAKLGLNASSFSMKITDTKPQFKSPLSYAKTVPQFDAELPDKRFMQSLNAQVSNLMMGYIGRQTGPGEPINYPLAWERDGAYSLMAIAKSGQLQTARELSVYFAENDFFGGFGAEGDAPGSAINALVEVAFLLNDPEYYQWVWPHIQRKLNIIDEMINAKDNVYKNFIGPLVPELYSDVKRRQLICMKTDEDLIIGTMDHHFPVLYINAISYRGLVQASRLALKLNKPEIAALCIEKANGRRMAWKNGFGKEKYDNERNFMISIWPSWITNKDNTFYVDKLDEQWKLTWNENGTPKERPLWTYFNVAEAHQFLFVDKPERTWETMRYFWNNQCSPGLYSYWEGNGEENSFKQWENYRGGMSPKYVTPHYWTASEMTLLQLDMLVYVNESQDEFQIVIGAGVPAEWLNESMSVKNYRTKAGVVSWKYKNHSLDVTLSGSDKKYTIRPGTVFQQNNVKMNVNYK